MDDGSEDRGSKLAVGSAIVAATLASACCILPVVFGAVGISAAAAAGFFEPFRPYLLGITAASLAGGFYFAYRPARETEGAACEVATGRAARFGKPMLWLETLAVVVLALFPSYAAKLQTSNVVPMELASSGQVDLVVLQVEGMTCESCTSGVKAELVKVPGVVGAEVIYAEQEARVSVRSGQAPKVGALIAAVERAGYRASLGP